MATISAKATDEGSVAVKAQRPSRILFGSCNSHHYPQKLWTNVRDRNAAAFVWGGDAIYADKTQANDDGSTNHHDGRRHATPTVFRKLYEQQLSHPDYSKVVKETFVFGTIDDHDYGIDNGDKNFVYKREAAIEFIETFLKFDESSAMSKRARSGAGVYGVKVFDFAKPVGQEVLSDEEAAMDPDATPEAAIEAPYSDRSVAVFVLDIRSNRTPWSKHPIKKFFPDYEGDFLGEAQWEWFKEALSRSKAAVNIIVTGLQVHNDRYPDPNIAEAWARFPTAQNRLYQLLMKRNLRSPILISGDVHFASLSRKDCTSGTATRPLFELTTSGMTHSWNTYFFAEEKSRLKTQFGYIPMATNMAMTFGHMVNPWSELVVDEGLEGAKSGLQYTLDLNFGELEFDWVNRYVHTRVHGVHPGKPLLSVKWKMDDLHDFPKSDGPWGCVNYRGVVDPIYKAFFQGLSLMVLILCVFGPTIIAILVVVVSYRHFRHV